MNGGGGAGNGVQGMSVVREAVCAGWARGQGVVLLPPVLGRGEADAGEPGVLPDGRDGGAEALLCGLWGADAGPPLSCLSEEMA